MEDNGYIIRREYTRGVARLRAMEHPGRLGRRYATPIGVARRWW
jgi:hypothetical protein